MDPRPGLGYVGAVLRRLVVVVAAAFACASPAPDRWETIVPGGETVCSDGSPYRFFVHRGNPDKLLVEFEGGGACWDAETCEAALYTRSVLLDPGDLARRGLLQGIYDRTRPDNPVHDFTHVYIPYCTGDLHWGNVARTYQGRSGPYTVRHRGAANAKAALGWTYENVRAPRQLLVAGCSAGGYGATLWSADVMARYPSATAAHLSDSAAGIVPDGFFASVLQTWGVASSPAWPASIPSLSFDRLDTRTASMADLYDGIAGHFPLSVFSQYNTLQDSTQISYYRRGGAPNPQDWSARMLESIGRIEQRNSNFTSFTAPGSRHCIINQAEVYTAAVEGVPFLEWLRTLAAGRRPPSVP